MKKISDNSRFFLGHLYDEVAKKYNIDGDQTRALIKYLQNFEGDNVLLTVKNLLALDDKDKIEKLMVQVNNLDVVKEPYSIQPRDTFAIPVGIKI